MKKTLLFLFALLMTSLTMMAQDAENLALEKTAIASSGNAALAVDGNTGTRWESAFEDPQTWQVDLGSAQEFNTIVILWEGAYGKTFTIEVGDNVGDGGYLTGGTEVVNIENQELSGFPHTQTLKFDAKTARYIKFTGTARGTTYGYSFYEFSVYNIDYANQTLGSITVPDPDKADALKTAVKVGENITISAFDTNGTAMESGVTFAATNGTITDAGVFTPSAKGVCTITATQDEIVKTATVYAYEGDDLLLNMTGTANDEASSVNLFTNGNWGDRGGLGAPADNHTWVYYDLGAYYTIDLVDLKQEQACGKNYTIQFSNDGTSWTDAYTVTDEAGMAGDVRHYFFGSDQNTNVRFVRFDCTEPATGYGVSIYEIAAYGVKTAEIEDSEAPTDFTATLKSVSFTSVKLSLQATDNVSAITYVVSRDGADDVTFDGASGAEITAVVGGLAPATEYTFSVVAKDLKDNATTAQTVTATTSAWTAAPAPTESEDNVYSLLSDTYTNNNGYNYAQWWEGQAKFEELTIDGDKVWHISDFVFIGSEHTGVDASGFDKLHIDVLPVDENLTLGVCPIGTEGKYVNTPELTAGQWNSVDISIADLIAAGQNLTSVTQLKLTGKDGANGAGTQEFYLDNIYYVKSGAPVEITAITVTATATSIEIGKTTQLTVKNQAASTVASSKLTFSSSDETIATVSEAGVVTGVAIGEATITATLKDNESVKNTITITVTAAAEHQGQELTADGHTIWVRGNHYVADGTYELFIESDEDMDGLGGSYWYVNGVGIDMREGLVLSADNKTITITVSSTTAPEIFTPLYVMMPGEVNFGNVTIQWNEIGDDTTGISTIDNSTNSQSDNVIYDLQGRKLSNGEMVKWSNGQLSKGIYIINGKKVAVK